MAKIRRIDNKKLAPVSRRKPYVLYVALAVLSVSVMLELFSSNFKQFLSNGIGFLMLLGSTWLISQGLSQKADYSSATITKAPNVHYLMMGALALGLSISFLSFFGDMGLLRSLFLGLLGVAGSLMYYGNDPKDDKTSSVQGISADLVIKTISEANEKIDYIESESSKIDDARLSASVKQAVSKAKEILKTIEEDPKDIRVSRKFLIVYIDGVKNVVDSYNQMDTEDIDEQTKDKIYQLFEDVEKRFDKELDRLKSNNQFDLDVHIDTLKEQIKN